MGMTDMIDLVITISVVSVIIGATMLLLGLMAWAAVLVFQMVKQEMKDGDHHEG